MIIIDTNVLSELMRPNPSPNVLDWMYGMKRGNIGITSITVAEILYGINSLPEGKRKQRLLEAAGSVFDEYFSGRILAFDLHSAIEYADIVLGREKSGQTTRDSPLEIQKTSKIPG